MTEDGSTKAAENPPRPYRVRLPGFLIEEGTGLGDVLTRVTYAIGITPCGGCQQRATALNRWMVFTNRL
jgi:hypothetical protein